MSDARPTAPRVGDVWRYPFVWSREAADGETEGRKDRPCVVPVVVTTEEGGPFVYFLPITTQAPRKGRSAMEVPQTELRRAGLATDGPSWVMLDEYNRDRLGASYYVQPNGYMGRFSPAFLDPLRLRFARLVAARVSAAVARDR
ncbi:hypothetical protein [Jannaschia sp. LMIT008]|uniref:hypothetical protein n=1 Tax=Jannaschia maritima TaxID=3032585 RepID=UPI002811AAC6|nr:hypothetical protein [Jannaschia sp. LMIT008]